MPLITFSQEPVLLFSNSCKDEHFSSLNILYFFSPQNCETLTINVLLILEVRDIVFFAGEIYNGAFRDQGQGPREKSQEMRLYVLPQTRSWTFTIRGILVFLCQ